MILLLSCYQGLPCLIQRERPWKNPLQIPLGLSSIIHPLSSPLPTGYFFVEKKDKTPWPCNDDWVLCSITRKEKNLTFEPLQGDKIFSKLDLQNHLRAYDTPLAIHHPQQKCKGRPRKDQSSAGAAGSGRREFQHFPATSTTFVQDYSPGQK